MIIQRPLTALLWAGLMSAALCSGAQTPTVITLETLFEVAESQSLQLRPSLAAETEARADVSVARSHRLPDISTTLSFSYIGDGFTTKRNFSDYQKAHIPHFGNTLAINLSQPVYTGGAITSGIRLAEEKLTASRLATELCRDNIRLRLAGFYLDIYKYSNLRRVVDNNIVQARQVLEQIRRRHEQGMALLNDITRYELLVSNFELQLIKIDNLLSILNSDLVALAGLPEGTVIQPDSLILQKSLPSTGEAEWKQEAATHSPALALARSKVEISRRAEALTRAERLPKVALQAGWSFDGPILVEVPPINRNLSYWFVGVGLSYNLSSLYKTNKSLARSRAATAVAVDELSATAENTDLAVHADYIKYLEAYPELQTQQKSLELAERNYSTVFTRFSSGMALITDMLDAANSKLDAEQQLVNARISIIYSYYKLLFTSGKI